MRLFLWAVLVLPLITSFHFFGFAPAPSLIEFVDVASQAGLQAEIICGGPEKRWIPEANGSGAAWLDFDNDGWMDLLIVNGAPLEALKQIVSGKPAQSKWKGVYLFRNLGKGRFEDVTARSGLENPFWGTGANAADYNNDGLTDILITTIGVDLLYRNDGNGKFSEIGRVSGLSQKIAWHTGSAFGDFDNDGYLDLYVVGYVNASSLPLDGPPPICHYRGLPVFCGPTGLQGEEDILYHNNRDGTFSQVTEKARVCDKDKRYGFTAVFDDFNQDGRPDLFVANDSNPNYLYFNQGDGTFQEAAVPAGVAVNADAKTQANMGVAVGDFDNDEKTDILTTTFSEDYFPLFKQQAAGLFEDVSFAVGLGAVTMPDLGWGCGFADLDNDGDRDLWLANGHVFSGIDRIGMSQYLQQFEVFENRANKFSSAFKFPKTPTNSYRGACAGDFDNDGDLDILLLPIAGSPVLLANQTGGTHSWIGFHLQGRQSNRDGTGARVRIEACGQVQYQSLRNGGSYLSRDDPRVHFGLGSCSKVDRATIVWPSGKVQMIKDPTPNRYIPALEP